MTPPLLIILAITAAALSAADDEARDIVRRSMTLHERNAGLARDYTFLERIEERRLDSQGRETSKESRTYDTTILYGIPYRRLIRRDDRPLSPREERKEQEKLARILTERKSESETQKKGRLSEYETRRERGRAYLREIPDAFDFRLLGEEQRQGRAVHVIDAIPRAGYQPRDARAKTLPRLHAKLWIDKSDLQWMRVEAEVIDTISVWLFLARLGTGSRLEFEQTRVNDQIWLPQIVRASGAMRIALLKKLQGDVTITYSHYRKFQSESEVLKRPAHAALHLQRPIAERELRLGEMIADKKTVRRGNGPLHILQRVLGVGGAQPPKSGKRGEPAAARQF